MKSDRSRRSSASRPRPGYLGFERHAGRAEADRVHVGDVVGDGFEPPLERHLGREGDVKPVLHDVVLPA